MSVRILQKQNGRQKRPASAVVSSKTPKKREIDYTFLLLVVVMTCVGLTMLLSVSAPTASSKFGNSYYFFMRQLSLAAVGFVAMIVISKIDYHKFKPFVRIFMIVCTILLVLVLIPGIGKAENNSRRWIQLPGFRLQPSEFMKLAIAMFFAKMIEDTNKDISKVRNMVPYFMWIALVAALMLMETHVSGAIVICGIAVLVLIAGGANFKFFVGCGIAAIPAGMVFLMMFPKRWGRVISFLNPFMDTQDKGFQVVQGLYAIGSGGMFGLGLGQSVQKYSYLPEPYNDFIFSIICEELGFIGMALIIGLFIALIVRGIKIAFDAPDVFGSLTVVGIMAHVGIQTVLNIAVVTSSIPNTGISLPFFSYGGTAIMVLLMEMGIVLSISRYRKEKELPGITTDIPKKKIKTGGRG